MKMMRYPTLKKEITNEVIKVTGSIRIPRRYDFEKICIYLENCTNLTPGDNYGITDPPGLTRRLVINKLPDKTENKLIPKVNITATGTITKLSWTDVDGIHRKAEDIIVSDLSINNKISRKHRDNSTSISL